MGGLKYINFIKCHFQQQKFSDFYNSWKYYLKKERKKGENIIKLKFSFKRE